MADNANGAVPQRREFPLAEIGGNAEFLALLNHGQVETIHKQEATLEEIFIDVTTGRAL